MSTGATQVRAEVAHDTRLAEMYGELSKAQTQISYAAATFCSVMGGRGGYVGRRRVMVKPGTKNPTYASYRDEMTAVDAFELFEALSDEQKQARNLSRRMSPAEAVASLTEKQAAAKVISEEIVEFEESYTGWSRFFVVTSSKGHIHSSMSCSTCRYTTTFGWLPELSGQTEKDAVDEYGSVLCSVCFPSAPVEWVGGKLTKSAAAKAAA